MTARFFQLFTGICATAVSCHPQPGQPRYDKVVLVHGILEDGVSFEPLRQRLVSHGIQCHVPQLKPSDARDGIDKLAESLKEGIDKEFGPDERFALVGFSMGGLVSRYYLQNLGGAERCETFITVSSPPHGTKMAYAYPGKGARQMRPGSPFLKELEATEDRLGDIPVVSYRTPMDLIILPTESSVWERAENHSHPVILHPLMLYSKPVLDDIEKRMVIDKTGA
jgi:triacylglycerol lipase